MIMVMSLLFDLGMIICWFIKFIKLIG